MDRLAASQAVGTIFFLLWGWMFMEACYSDHFSYIVLVILSAFPMDAIVKAIAGQEHSSKDTSKGPPEPRVNPFDADGG